MCKTSKVIGSSWSIVYTLFDYIHCKLPGIGQLKVIEFQIY